jgi:vacuolar protein sorting-associated protein 1
MRSSTGVWSCSISLQFDNGSSRTVTPFGSKIYTRSEVEIWIRRAQAAVLSPHRPETDFLKKSEHELKTEVDPKRLEFSKDSVRVDIMDPESPNLDFVDLPGEFLILVTRIDVSNSWQRHRSCFRTHCRG